MAALSPQISMNGDSVGLRELVGNLLAPALIYRSGKVVHANEAWLSLVSMSSVELFESADLTTVFSVVQADDTIMPGCDLFSGNDKKHARVLLELASSKLRVKALVLPLPGQHESARLLLVIDEFAGDKTRIEKARRLHFLNTGKDWFWELDRDLRYSWLSDNTESLTGHPPRWFYGKQCFEFAPAGSTDEQQWTEHIAQMKRHVPFVEFVFQITRADGQMDWVRIRGAPFFDTEGQFDGYRGTGSDVNDLKLLEIALRESEKRFRQFAETAGDWFWEMDAENRFTYLSEHVLTATGRAPEFFLGKTREEIFGADTLREPEWIAHYEVLARREPFRDFVYRAAAKDGTNRNWIRVSGSPKFSSDGEYQGYAGCASVITNQVLDQLAREQSEARFRDFSEIAADWFWELNSDLEFVYVSDRFQDVCGVSPKRLLGMHAGELERKYSDFHVAEVTCADSIVDLFELEKPFTQWQFNWKHPDGRILRISLNSRSIFDEAGNCNGHRGIATDVTQSYQLSTELEYRANHDVLTGLCNRLEFDRHVKSALDQASDMGLASALLYIDLDQFKVVNDSVGHLAGDELLKSVADLIRSQVRRVDVVARLGGDEFGVLLNECSVAEAGLIANHIAETIREFTFTWDKQAFRISSSIGVVPILESSDSVVQIMSNADIACYAAKDAGRNRISHYGEHDEAVRRQRTHIFQAAGIRDALNQGRFRLYKQVILPIASDDEVLRFELLLRLMDNDNKIISPGAVIPAAERFGIMPSIDRWVLNTAFENLSYLRSLHPGCIVSINLSGTTISDASLPQYIESLLAVHDVEPGAVCFEVTETALISNLNTAGSTIKLVKELGHSFALDDFGSGMSSFAYLKHLPVDFLKIDGGFVKDIVEDETDLAVVAAINEIAHKLGIQTIAEYVESTAIVEKLSEIGVDYGQGFALGKPVSLDQADAILYTPPRTSSVSKDDTPPPIAATA